jgi:hypothetical protein
MDAEAGTHQKSLKSFFCKIVFRMSNINCMDDFRDEIPERVAAPTAQRARVYTPLRRGEEWVLLDQRGEGKPKMKKNILKPRNFLVPLMRLHCKPGPHGGKKRLVEMRGRRWMQEYSDELASSGRT